MSFLQKQQSTTKLLNCLQLNHASCFQIRYKGTLHLMRELLLFNLAKTLPKYAHGKVYFNILKDVKLISKHYQQQFTFINATVHLFCRNVFFCLHNTPASLSGYKA